MGSLCPLLYRGRRPPARLPPFLLGWHRSRLIRLPSKNREWVAPTKPEDTISFQEIRARSLSLNIIWNQDVLMEPVRPSLSSQIHSLLLKILPHSFHGHVRRDFREVAHEERHKAKSTPDFRNYPLKIYDRYSEMYMDLEITKGKVPKKEVKDQIKKGRAQIEKRLRNDALCDRESYVRDYQVSEDALELLLAQRDPARWAWANTRNYVLGNKSSDAMLPLSQRLYYLGFQLQNSQPSEEAKSAPGILFDGNYTYAPRGNEEDLEATLRRIKSDTISKSFEELRNSSLPLSRRSSHVYIYISPRAQTLKPCSSNGIIPFKTRSELRRKVKTWTHKDGNWFQAAQKLKKQASLRYESPIHNALDEDPKILVILWLTQILRWRPTREQADAAMEESSRGLKELALQSPQNSKASPDERHSCE